MGVVAVIIGLAILVSIGKAMMSKEAAQKNIVALSSINGFNPVVSFGGGSWAPGVALDPATSQFAITKAGQQPRVYSFDQLVAAEVERNGSSVSQTNRGSQVAGAAVGAVILGPLGLLVGGLSGSKRNVEKVRKLSLKVYTNDLVTPVTELTFFMNKQGLSPENTQVRAAAQQLDEWYGRFQTILKGRVMTVQLAPAKAAPAIAAPEPTVFPLEANDPHTIRQSA